MSDMSDHVLTDGSETEATADHKRPQRHQDGTVEDLKATPSRALGLLTLPRENLHHFTEDVLSVFKDHRTGSSALSLLRNDLSQLKEVVSSVFRLRPSTERHAFRVKVSGGTSDARNQNLLELSPTGCQSADRPSDSKDKTLKRSDNLSQVGHSPDHVHTPWDSLDSMHPSHVPETDDNTERLKLRTLKNSACYLTFDPNTANSEVRLSERNRTATRVWPCCGTPQHPERFLHCPQVLCREGLLAAAYWELLWSGGADVGVCYNSVSRSGAAASCLLGHNEHSWSLECSDGGYTPSHCGRRFPSHTPRTFTRTVGIHLDWAAGSLSFYSVQPDAMVHLHTFTAAFSEPLYPAVWLWAYDASVTLTQVELDWERLLR